MNGMLETARELTGQETRVLQFLFVIALLSVVLPITVVLLRGLIRALKKEVIHKAGTGKTLFLVTVFSLLSIFFLRYGVGLYVGYIDTESAMLWWEEISNSLIHTLQTFGAGEDYELYVNGGKTMMNAISGGSRTAVSLYSAFVWAMNLVAPIAGGAMLFEILTSVFPKIKLFFAYLMFFNRKYYFSKLNEQSLALAVSMMEAYSKKSFPKARPVMVFCDVYTDRENEKETELLLGAKAIGAICVREDLAHIPKNIITKRTFFLIDREDREINNVRLLADMAEGRGVKCLRNAEVFLFVSNDAYTGVRSLVYKRLKDECGFTEEQLPVVIPVNCNSNLVCNLLADLPLYESLVEDKRCGRELSLNVSILGDGALGREMLLSAYWFGQILDCRLNINVFSSETEDEVMRGLDLINPEIRESLSADSELLKYTDDGAVNPPYCRISCIKCDISADIFEGETGRVLLNSDYIFISSASDEESIAAAEKLRREVGRYHLENGLPTKTVIAYTVGNTGLCNALNRESSFDFSASDDSPDVYARAVGSLDSVYSVKNVFCTDYELVAEEISSRYDSITNGERRRSAVRAERRRNDDYYTRANLARAMHVKYKMFSAGLITTSVFEAGGVDSPLYKDALSEAYGRYKELVRNTPDSPLIRSLAWLEHRRWVAFMRTLGFRGTDSYAEYMKKFDRRAKRNGDKGVCEHKHFALRLHPLIVECSRDGSRDRLSAVSEEICRIKGTDVDYKAYDYPSFDFE